MKTTIRHSFLHYCFFASFVSGCDGDVLVAKTLPDEIGDSGDGREGGIEPGADATLAKRGVGFPAPECDWSASTLPPPAPGACDENGWCWENPLPFGTPGRFVRSATADGPWVLTQRNLLHVNVTETALERSALPPMENFDDALVLASDDVWVLGRSSDFFLSGVFHFDGQTWTDFTSETEHVMAFVGFAGSTAFALMYDATEQWFVSSSGGAPWQRIAGASSWPGTEFGYIRGSVVLSEGEFCIVNADGLSCYRNGMWDLLTSSINSDVCVDAMSASTSDDIWLAGSVPEDIGGFGNDLCPNFPGAQKAALSHWNGTALTAVDLPNVATIIAIGRVADNDVWFGTTAGELLHFDGSKVTLNAFQATRPISGFFVRNAADITAILGEEAGGIVHFDGTRWSDASPMPTVNRIQAMWGSAANDVWAVGTGGLRWHYDGTRWTDVSASAGDFTSIWGSATDNVWAVTRQGAIEHYDGSDWSLAYQTDAELGSLWGTGESTLWMVASRGGLTSHAAYFDGRALEVTEGEGTAIWASSDRDVWIVGGPTDVAPLYPWLYDDVSIQHFDGATWQPMSLPFATTPDTSSVWGRGPDDIWVGGAAGVFHYDGSHWLWFADDVYPTHIGGCGDAVWFGAPNDVALYDGVSLSLTPIGRFDQTNSAFWGSSPDNLLAGGGQGALLRRTVGR